MFPVTVGALDTVKVARSPTHTPLPVLLLMLALPFMLKVPLLLTYTPPPFVALLLLTLVASPFMLKVPLLLTYTPPP